MKTILALCLCAFALPAYSQSGAGAVDSTEITTIDDREEGLVGRLAIGRSIDIFDWKTPTVSLRYGSGSASLASVAAPLFAPTTLDIDLGKRHTVKFSPDIYVVSKDHLNIGIINSGLGKAAAANEQDFSAIRLMSVDSRGYGWDMGAGWTLELTNGNAFGWTWMSFDSLRGVLSAEEQSLLSSYGTGVRFGTMSDAVVSVSPASWLSVDAGFQRQGILRRFIFWEHAVSGLVSATGYSLIDAFTYYIQKSSPAGAMITSFVLKSAYSYGVYELRKKNMNWPFESEPATVVDTWRVGLTVNF